MPRLYYYVVTSGQQWEVKYDGQPAGTRYLYNTQDEALQVARTTARKHHTDNGVPSGVKLQGANSLWRDEATYGDDPFPPRG